MGSKELLLSDLARRDPRISAAHDLLVETGLKWKGPSNTVTLLYYFRASGKDVGVAALRGSPSVFSFPARFWLDRPGQLRQALEMAGVHQIATEGFVSSSQYSGGQIRISDATLPIIRRIIENIIVPECNRAGANLT